VIEGETNQMDWREVVVEDLGWETKLLLGDDGGWKLRGSVDALVAFRGIPTCGVW
jgi:hypothetical protein